MNDRKLGEELIHLEIEGYQHYKNKSPEGEKIKNKKIKNWSYPDLERAFTLNTLRSLSCLKNI